MIVALDHDGACDRDPALWNDVVGRAKARGHSVIQVTMRHDNEPIGRAPARVPIYYTGRQAKRPYMAALGIEVDVWIDDEPMWVLRDSSGGHIEEEW